MCCYNFVRKTCPGLERNRETYRGMGERKAGKRKMEKEEEECGE